jgi:hypothetical protein
MDQTESIDSAMQRAQEIAFAPVTFTTVIALERNLCRAAPRRRSESRSRKSDRPKRKLFHNFDGIGGGMRNHSAT